MLLISLLLVPMIGMFTISMISDNSKNLMFSKTIVLTTSVMNFFISLVMFILFNFSSNQFQFVQEYHSVSSFDFYLGMDGMSMYFVLLTTMMMPMSLLSNWSSISENVKSYIIMILLLETLLLGLFTVLDVLLFYIFFESMLPSLFLLMGIFGSSNSVSASFYLFLYTLLGSLFLLLSVLTMSSMMGTTDFDAFYKTGFFSCAHTTLFGGMFMAFVLLIPININSKMLNSLAYKVAISYIFTMGMQLPFSLLFFELGLIYLMPVLVVLNVCTMTTVYTFSEGKDLPGIGVFIRGCIMGLFMSFIFHEFIFSVPALCDSMNVSPPKGVVEREHFIMHPSSYTWFASYVSISLSERIYLSKDLGVETNITFGSMFDNSTELNHNSWGYMRDLYNSSCLTLGVTNDSVAATVSSTGEVTHSPLLDQVLSLS